MGTTISFIAMLQKGRVFLSWPQQDTNIVLFLRLKNLGGSSACGAARGGGDETSETDGELFDTEEPSRDT